MKKIFFITLLFQSIHLNQLQAFFELYNDTKGTVRVEAQFDKHISLISCPNTTRDLKPGQQRVKIDLGDNCINRSISFTTTDDKGVQRKATLNFTGAPFDPGIATFKNSQSANYWFALKTPDRGGYVIKVPFLFKETRDALSAQGFKPSTMATHDGNISVMSKTGEFFLK